MLKECTNNVRKTVPLVHNITNYVTVNDVANPNNQLEAAAATVCTMGLAGEIGYSRMQEGDGNSNYRNRIIDAICEAVSIPVIAIDGITQENVKELADSGICGIAVISAIYGQKDIKAASEKLKEATEKMVQA